MAILTKPCMATFGAASDSEARSRYQEAFKAWEGQKDNAPPFWTPYSGVPGAYAAEWAKAKAWEGKRATVTRKDGTVREGVVRLSTANAANGSAGIAVAVFDGWADNWCGSDFLAIEEA